MTFSERDTPGLCAWETFFRIIRAEARRLDQMDAERAQAEDHVPGTGPDKAKAPTGQR